MAKRGPKATPPALQAVAGTAQPCRERSTAFEDIDGPATLPADFEDLKAERPKVAAKVLRAWNRKIAVYEMRGQNVAGFEPLIYQYCLLEVEINEAWNSGGMPSMTMMTQYRQLACEFHDSSASNVTTGKPRKGNAFGNNGKPPRRA